jgi:hypothetical protein
METGGEWKCATLSNGDLVWLPVDSAAKAICTQRKIPHIVLMKNEQVRESMPVLNEQTIKKV